tara:strand:- start:241 stop:438 length:198 start_codon:yes stop_codon:yes gene_type:complete
VDNEEINLSKKILSSYKERLENEIIQRSIKLKISSKICEEIIENHNEINELKKAIYELDNLKSRN